MGAPSSLKSFPSKKSAWVSEEVVGKNRPAVPFPRILRTGTHPVRVRGPPLCMRDKLMHRKHPTGLKSRNLIAKSLRSCLGPEDLPYNWDQKLRGIILAVALARCLELKSIARFLGCPVKTGVNRVSKWLAYERLNLSKQRERIAIAVLRRIGGRRLYLYRGKVVVIIDGTEHEKPRSRGKKKRMPLIGRVRMKNLATKEKVLAPGYHEIWLGVLLKNRTCLGVTRFLFSDKAPWFRSQGKLEEIEIRRMRALVWKALKRKIILIGDRGYGRKELLNALSEKPRTDFVIRLQGDLNVKLRGHRLGLLSRLAPWQPVRCLAHWRENTKKTDYCAVSAFSARLSLSKREFFRVRLLSVTSTTEDRPTIYLATTLPIEKVEEIRRIVWLYSSRWTIETFFFNFKESFGAGKMRVFASWNSIDRLFDLAHMAYMILTMIYLIGMTSRHPQWRRLRRLLESARRRWSIRKPGWTFGGFMEALSILFLMPMLVQEGI